ncbi:MAG: Lrp/AsnC ligand binding domain-containing protein [Bacteroidales bacterium]|nr:Lrp/AsnC ligand binding domain-containing protein [Bacteroidales bacterium]
MPESGYKVDAIDQKILSYLVKNARMPFLEIARECGISGAAIHQRVRKMEEAGIIDGSRVVVGEKAMGFDVCCFVGIELVSTNRYTDVVERLRQMPEVVECHFITGQFAMLVKMYCRNNEHLMDVLVNNIQNIEGISRTETFISLDRAIERPVYVKDRGVLGR